jgi:hypothetical protein
MPINKITREIIAKNLKEKRTNLLIVNGGVLAIVSLAVLTGVWEAVLAGVIGLGFLNFLIVSNSQ